MKLRRSGLVALALIIIMAMLATGCGSQTKNPSGNQNPGNKTEKPIKLTLWTGYPELDPWLLKMAEAYNKENPNITVEVLSFPLRDFEKKVTTSITSKSCADIISSTAMQSIRFIQEDMILKAPDDLSKFVTSGAYDPAVVNDAQYEGITYGIPHMMGFSALYYNTDHFAEAGLTEPPKSMDELIAYANKLAKKNTNGKTERAGISLRLSGSGSGVAEKFWVLLMQNGGSVVEEVSPGKFRAGYNNEAGLKTLQMYVDMVHKDHVDDPTLKHDAEAFEMGVASMFVRETWVINEIAQKAPDLNYKTAPLFGANLANACSWYVTNSAEGDKSQAAWDFVRYLMDEENHKEMVKMSGWLPARNDLDMTDYIAENPAFEAFFAEYENVYTMPLIAEFDELETKFADRLSNIGFTDPSFVGNTEKMKAFLDDCAAETNEILKENGHLAE